MVRLHLGCGNKRFRDYVNIDNTGTPDLLCDITALPYGEGTVDEILVIHTFEHLFPWEAPKILGHWYKLLKPGGKLVMEMPDLKKVLKAFTLEKPPLAYTMYALYGGEQTGRVEDVHKWCWTYDTIAPIMKEVGYATTEKPAMYHVWDRDFIVEGVK